LPIYTGCGIMLDDINDYAIGDAEMTDFRYKQLIEMIYQILKANFELGKSHDEILEIIAALKKDISVDQSENTMTDYQFKYLMELKDMCDALMHEKDALYQLVKSHAEAGNSSEEILNALEALRKD
jgi:hemerythrin